MECPTAVDLGAAVAADCHGLHCAGQDSVLGGALTRGSSVQSGSVDCRQGLAQCGLVVGATWAGWEHVGSHELGLGLEESLKETICLTLLFK